MQPTRAAWFFVAGLAWLVLRGIVGASVPGLSSADVVRVGGVLLVIPVCSVLASATIPLFFWSFLRHHSFAGQRGLKVATVVALVASVASLVLVVVSLFSLSSGTGVVPPLMNGPLGWTVDLIPAIFVGALLVFLVAFARQCPCDPALRSAAWVAAIGALVPVVMMVAAGVYSRFPDAMPWLPDVGSSLISKGLGLAAAAALLWFAETFAVRYRAGENGPV